MRNANANLKAVLSAVASVLAVNGANGEEPVQGKYVDVNGLKMYYEVHGAGGTPLVLLHGGGSTIETTFGRVLPTFAKSRQVIAFEQQGHGRTNDIADRPFSFEQSADDVASLLQRLKIEKADLFGFSNGGSIALQTAIRHPRPVRKLAIASAMFKRDGMHPEFWKFMKGATLQNMPQVLKDAYLKTSPHPDRLQDFHDKCVNRMLGFKDWRTEDMQSIKAPTLVIVGDADSVRPEHAVEMFRLLPHAKLAVLPGGHGEYIGEATAAKLEHSQVKIGGANAASKKESRLPELTAALIEEFLDAPMPAP